MRNEDGIYVGAQTCKHFVRIEKFSTKTCCGGRIVGYAFVRCALKGVVEAETACSSSSCADRQEGR